MSISMNINFRIYTEDTDWGGVVYHSNYLKFYERARSDLLREGGVSQSDLKTKLNLAFVVSSMEIKFIKSAKIDDIITAKTKVAEIKKASIIIDQEIHCNNILINRARVVLAILDTKRQRPVRIPELIIKAISK
ncbi:MAG: acyl-CoA thioester hydrolase [Rickettsiales bacterium]|jgi:acyl-CoA thioester hydrolase